MTLFRKLGEQEDGRLTSQNNHLTGERKGDRLYWSGGPGIQ